MTDIIIEKGVPVPERKYREYKYPYQGMDIGDSFAVTVPEGRSSSSMRSQMYSCARAYCLKVEQEKKFKVAIEPPNKIRTWRIK
jgi:hypothetical protein